MKERTGVLKAERQSTDGGLRSFAIKTLSKVVKKSGTLVKKEHGDARVEVCRSCPNFGIVLTEVGLKTEGCKICLCPSITKPYMDTYLSLTTLMMTKAKCSDSENNRWAEVDNIFFNKVN